MTGTGEEPGPPAHLNEPPEGAQLGPLVDEEPELIERPLGTKIAVPGAGRPAQPPPPAHSEQRDWRRFAYICTVLAMCAFVITVYYTNRRLDQVTRALAQGRQSDQSFIATSAEARKNFLADQRAQTQLHAAEAASAAAQQHRAEKRLAIARQSQANAQTLQAYAQALLANAQANLAAAQTTRQNAVGPAEQLAAQAQAFLAESQTRRQAALSSLDAGQQALANAQARREAALSGPTAKLSALIQRIRQSLGGPGSNQTAAQRLATYQLALQLVQLIGQIGSGPAGS